MTGSPPTPTQPTFRLQPPAVDFIENHLSEYHEAFNSSMVQYDTVLGQFVAHVPANTIMSQLHTQTLIVPIAPGPAQPRPEQGPIAHMEFWDRIFPQAMERLRGEEPTPMPTPTSRYDLEWSIRQLPHWKDVQNKLDEARRAYDFDSSATTTSSSSSTPTGADNVSKSKGGRFRRKMRSFMDTHHVTAQQAMQVVPNVEIASPIIGVINLMLDVRLSCHGRRANRRSQMVIW